MRLPTMVRSVTPRLILSVACAVFLGACAEGSQLAEAAGTVMAAHPLVDIAALLSGLLTAGALICPASNEERPS